MIDFVQNGFSETRFFGSKLGLFSPVKFKISWPSRFLWIHRQWLLSISFQVSWHHTLKNLFLVYWIKNINTHCRCIQRSCLPWESMYIQHRSFLGWKFEPDDKRQRSSWYQRYISSPSFSVRWNLTVANFLLQVLITKSYFINWSIVMSNHMINATPIIVSIFFNFLVIVARNDTNRYWES